MVNQVFNIGLQCMMPSVSESGSYMPDYDQDLLSDTGGYKDGNEIAFMQIMIKDY